MYDGTDHAQKITEMLRPHTRPLAVKLLAPDEAMPKRVHRPAKLLKHRVTVCQAVSMARRYGWKLGLLKDDVCCAAALLAYGWGLGMHPFHNPIKDLDGKLLEVRASKDILVPIKDLKAVRYLKKDKYGRVRKALFEPDQNARVRGQIDNLLSEITMTKWQEEEF